MADERKPFDPALIVEQYEAGVTFKNGLGTRGLYKQAEMNERFFIGDQWHGANAGADRPLVRHNVIKRIGDYKMAVIGSNPIAVNYSADGVPNTIYIKESVKPVLEGFSSGLVTDMSQLSELGAPELSTDEEINLVMSAMSDYFRVTAERVNFDSIKESALRNAYTSGTGVVYTYWDDQIRTGLYADEGRKSEIRGDIACEVLDIENVYFGDPNTDDVQGQPYIIIAQRKSIEEVRREAKRWKAKASDVQKISADRETQSMAGEMASLEPAESQKTTLLTKLWKEWADDGGSYVIKAVQVVKGATIRPEWELGVRLYPIAKFSWERRRSCIYGESEITHLIPNQIAINRMITASVWAVMVMGMPIMVVNGDIIQDRVTNDPGQVIKVFGGTEDVERAIRYVNPPNFSPKFEEISSSLINNTLTQAGANDAALGDIRAENTSAIIAVREAATMPMQLMQNRYYAFCEEIARIWAEFWVMHYGKRSLKVENEGGTWYLPFEGERYKDLLISTRVDVGASTLWSESQAIRTLDNLFDRQVIDVVQYLSRLPKGIVQNVSGLIRDKQAEAGRMQAMQSGGESLSPASISQDSIIASLSPEYQEKFDSMEPQTKAALLKGAVTAQDIMPETMPIGQIL